MRRRVCTRLAATLVLASGPAAAQTDTATYGDSATRALVGRARARHIQQDSLVRDYQATISTRLDLSAGRSRFARQFPLFAHETTGRLTWRRPNDLHLAVRGARVTSAMRGVRAELGYDRPWFVPRALGDSIRLMGVPETAALHPLALGADQVYRYAIADSVVIDWLGRTIRAVAVRVTPKRLAPSVVAGDLWIDRATADVVRLQATFLGEYLWDAPREGATSRDSARARRDSRWAQRFVTVQADLEYSLHEGRFWMPHRQTLAILVEADLLVRGAVPARAITTFSDYRINADVPITFVPVSDGALDHKGRTLCAGEQFERCPRDERAERGFVRTGIWEGGRWEVDVPPRDSLVAYQWLTSLTLDLDPTEEERIRRAVADLSRLGEELPDAWMGRRRLGLGWEQLADVARFNRVQGLSLGLGMALRPGPAFTTLQLQGRFGFSDARATGSLRWRRDAPGGRLAAGLYREVFEAEPWTRGQGLGNSLNALLAGHDDADYHLAFGGSLSYAPYRGLLSDVELRLAGERHRSMAVEASSGLNDLLGGSGIFPPNAPVREGDYLRASVSSRRRVGDADVRLGVEGLVGEAVRTGRGWVALKLPLSIAGRANVLSLRSAYAVGDDLPQLRFRAGGPATVRGYDYGTRTGLGGWAAQLDVSLSRSWLLAPVVFGDVGDVFGSGELDPLVGVGGGISLLGGWMRLNGAVGLNPRTDFRFDLLFGAPR